MSMLDWLFDGLLGLTLLWLAMLAVSGRILFHNILSFIGLGLLMALVWVRLGAPDVALAEAALGSGVTGALLLAAFNRLTKEARHKTSTSSAMRSDPRRSLTVWLALSLVVLIGIVVAWAIGSLPPESVGLTNLVSENLPLSGVRAQVTAILLNFRGYDTLLEVVVLLVALLGVWYQSRLHPPDSEPETGPVLEGLVKALVPVIVLVTGYILWLGGHAAGGAFQAGALLAGAGVLLVVTRADWLSLRDDTRLRALLVAGPLVFIVVAGGQMFAGRAVLQYPPEHAGSLILLIEAASTLSIGITLTLLFAGGRPRRGSKK